MGYLKSIKSPERYVRMMRALLFRMSEAERDEVCQEVRLHLEALVEDHQAEGHSPQEALALAIQQFGPPFKVGGEIARKWEVKKQRLVEATQPRHARQKKWLRYISVILASAPILFILNYHYWPVILAGALAHGLLSGLLFHYTQRVDAQTAAVGGPLEMRDWSTSREAWEENLPQLAEQLRQKQSLWGHLNLRIAQWIGNRAFEKDASSATKWKLAWQLVGLVYFAALVLWPAGNQLINIKCMLIFLYVSTKMSSLSGSLANKLSSSVKTPQI